VVDDEDTGFLFAASIASEFFSSLTRSGFWNVVVVVGLQGTAGGVSLYGSGAVMPLENLFREESVCDCSVSGRDFDCLGKVAYGGGATANGAGLRLTGEVRLSSLGGCVSTDGRGGRGGVWAQVSSCRVILCDWSSGSSCDESR
jgi:hypothetical protein